jgi:hypothetical protein
MRRTSFIGAVAFVMLLIAGGAWAQDDGQAVARLRAFDEVPAISSPGGGRFEAELVGDEIHWELTYFNVPGTVTQAHLHFAQPGVNGGIMVFLCSNLGNGPVGTEVCPPSGSRDAPATVSGTITAGNVGAGANAQGIAAGEFAELHRAIRAGIVYANVHTVAFPGGEIRGQLRFTPAEP